MQGKEKQPQHEQDMIQPFGQNVFEPKGHIARKMFAGADLGHPAAR